MRGGDTPRPWGAVLDPPRSGCEPDVLRFLADKKVERVVYVSCDPATFARDAKILTGSGYKLEKVQPLDLFPQTSHVELVAKFDFR
jgi:23S rRNA (uracil1939-C5)-methyltransferase